MIKTYKSKPGRNDKRGRRLTKYTGIALATVSALFGAGIECEAVPAYPYPIKTTQPDGSELTIIQRGDERMSWTFSEDGVLLTHGKDNALVYATTGADGMIVPSTTVASEINRRTPAERDFISRLDHAAIERAMRTTESMTKRRIPFTIEEPSTRAMGAGLFSTVSPFPSTGEQKILIVLVEYQDKKFKLTDPKKHYEDMLNKEGYKENGAEGSARDWFIRNSSGKFKPHFDIYGPITLPRERAYYGGDHGGAHDPKAYDMAVHACEILDPTVDFTQYDRNDDGYIDNIYIFYAGRGQADSNERDAVWPHSFDVVTATGQNNKFDGKILNHYATSNEVRGDNENFTGIGTFMHEFSHVMGLPDLYTTDYNTCFTPGAWSILDYGPYNNNGITPPNYSAYERYCLGWLTPEILLYDEHYELPPLQDSNKAYLVPTEDDDIIFMFENRQQKDFDQYIPGHGMLVWNIEFNQKVWNQNSVNNIPNRQYVDIIEADNRQEEKNRDGDSFPGSAGVTAFGPSTRPVFQTQTKTKIYYNLTNITEKDGKISFDLKTPNGPSAVEGVTDKTGYIKSEDGMIISGYDVACDVYDISGRLAGTLHPGGTLEPGSGVYIVSTPDGAVKILL